MGEDAMRISRELSYRLLELPFLRAGTTRSMQVLREISFLEVESPRVTRDVP
jgi:hypothetical protein